MNPDMNGRREEFRRHMLDAMDAWAKARYSHTDFVRVNRGGPGWKDQDLPHLFPALDEHFERCIARFFPEKDGTK
jgi:glycosidase